jgi:hypothetical protein
MVKGQSRTAVSQRATSLSDLWAQFFDKPNEELKVVAILREAIFALII